LKHKGKFLKAQKAKAVYYRDSAMSTTSKDKP